MITRPWKDRADYNKWWHDEGNGTRHNTLSVTDPKEWERVARDIDAFNKRMIQQEAKP